MITWTKIIFLLYHIIVFKSDVHSFQLHNQYNITKDFNIVQTFGTMWYITSQYNYVNNSLNIIVNCNSSITSNHRYKFRGSQIFYRIIDFKKILIFEDPQYTYDLFFFVSLMITLFEITFCTAALWRHVTSSLVHT